LGPHEKFKKNIFAIRVGMQNTFKDFVVSPPFKALIKILRSRRSRKSLQKRPIFKNDVISGTVGDLTGLKKF